MRRQTNQWLVPLLLAVGVAGALGYYRLQTRVIESPRAENPAAEVIEEPAPSPGPVHPVAAPVDEPDESPPLQPLPSLGESDEYFKLGVVDLFGEAISERLVAGGLIEKLVATIDNLPRDRVAGRIRPLNPVEGLFQVDGQDASGEYRISSLNAARYEALIELASNADLDEMMGLYRRFYPLFQSAYEDQGYPDAYFNDRLVEVIDHLLATPDVAGPIELVRPHVMYEYRNADLEALSSGQKLILRLGEQQAQLVKQRLRQLRTQLTTL